MKLLLKIISYPIAVILGLLISMILFSIPIILGMFFLVSSLSFGIVLCAAAFATYKSLPRGSYAITNRHAVFAVLSLSITIIMVFNAVHWIVYLNNASEYRYNPELVEQWATDSVREAIEDNHGERILIECMLSITSKVSWDNHDLTKVHLAIPLTGDIWFRRSLVGEHPYDLATVSMSDIKTESEESDSIGYSIGVDFVRWMPNDQEEIESQTEWPVEPLLRLSTNENWLGWRVQDEEYSPLQQLAVAHTGEQMTEAAQEVLSRLTDIRDDRLRKVRHALAGEVDLGLWDFFYYSVAAYTTLGTSDILPATTKTRVLLAFEALLAIFVLGYGLELLLRPDPDGQRVQEKEASGEP